MGLGSKDNCLSLITVLALVSLLMPGCGRWLTRPKGPELVAESLKALRDSPAAEERRRAVRTLGQPSLWDENSQKERGVRILTLLLETEAEPLVRAEAVRSLSQLGAWEPLLGSMDDPSPFVRMAACRALGQTVPRSSIPEPGAEESPPNDKVPEVQKVVGRLAEVLTRDPEFDVRLAAVEGLREIATQSAAFALRNGLADGDPAVRHRSREALTALLGRDLGPQPDRWDSAIASLAPGPIRPARWFGLSWLGR